MYDKIMFDLEIDLLTQRITSNDKKEFQKYHFHTNSHENEALHLFLALFVKNRLFVYLTLKLTNTPFENKL